jgi:predicted acylesterase/phospholipase RssA
MPEEVPKRKSSAAPFGQPYKFYQVFREEIKSINQRRGRTKIKLEREAETDNDGDPVLRPAAESTVVGLALSGGGIRSAAFCLGALQGLAVAGVLDRVDYLSTVSGGGYIGSSLSAGMCASGGKFPFTSDLHQDEPPSIQHLRDYSNYLFPHGAGDFLRNAAIYARGLFANAIVVAPFLLLGAVITIVQYPTVRELGTRGLLGITPRIGPFTLTAYLIIILSLSLTLWAIWRSWVPEKQPGETYKGNWLAVTWLRWRAPIVCSLVVATFFFELQPLILKRMFITGTSLRGFITHAAAILAPFAAGIGFFSDKIGEYVKNATTSPALRQRLLGWSAKAGIWIAAAVAPLILWAIYLELSYWGIQEVSGDYRAPAWLQYLAGKTVGGSIAGFYAVVCILLAILALWMQPNANSLNPLYRDRLGKAFLFRPARLSPRHDHDLKTNYIKLSALSAKFAPYHLLNAALNIQDSRVSNRRGRNADFFFFSRNFVGSHATRYVRTKDIEAIAPALDLAMAMAVSGAAFAPDMGGETIKPLAPTLALLNLRTGYWLRNPRKLTEAAASSKILRTRNLLANIYFLLEAFGLLNESRKSVYLTDGGHIENLGIYELLRRRCEIIIAVDAEADPQMNFPSFLKLERYARIDLGTRIELPWEKIQKITLKVGQEIDQRQYDPRSGPHCAIGEIEYPNGRHGIIIYIKSSITGDESDYIRFYRQKFQSFPHETTLDQMFSEEQFEVYRALGFHATFKLFNREDKFAFLDSNESSRTLHNLKRLDELFPLGKQEGRTITGQRNAFADFF